MRLGKWLSSKTGQPHRRLPFGRTPQNVPLPPASGSCPVIPFVARRPYGPNRSRHRAATATEGKLIVRTRSQTLIRGVGVGATFSLALGAASAFGASAPATVGPRSDGTAVAATGHRITPVGRQTALGDLPLAQELSPDGRTLLVSNDGQGTQSLQMVDVASGHVVQTLPYSAPKSLFVGLAFSPDGKTAYASGGGDQKVHRYVVNGQQLTEQASLSLPTTSPTGAKINAFPAGLAVTPDGSRLVVADHLADAVSVFDLATGAVQTTAVGHAPRSVTLSSDGRTAWVTDQGADTVSVLDVSGATPVLTGSTTVGTHPVAAALDPAAHRLYVANAESDEVSVLDAQTSHVLATWNLAPYKGAQIGVNPSDLALSQDGSTLYVTGAGNDDVVAVDTRKGKITGAVPTGWYPSAITVAGNRLLVANAKGLGAGPNNGTGYPNPTSTTSTSPAQYAGSMIVGTLSSVPLPLSAEELAHGSTQVAANNNFDAAKARQAKSSPIKHVIYVVQENRTFDQMFGSLGKGNGDPSLNLFGDESAPNSRALQKQYLTVDNFYADAEVSAQGWNWTTAAGSPLYAESLWPSNYSGRGAPYPSENGDPAIAPNRNPKDAYLWDHLADKGVSFRNYGFYVNSDAAGVNTAYDPVLNSNTDHAFRGFDLSCPNNSDTFKPLATNCGTPRFDAWKTEFDGYVSRGDLPTVELVRLPNDHTAGTRAGSPTPRAYVADNDLALGRLVDAVTHSRYGKDTAILVTEDDAQNGPDHVDAHRTVAQVISPYTRTGAVDSTLYTTASMVRTVEDIVGIGPLTQFDAQATPMTGTFTSEPDLAPYTAVRPSEAGTATNSPSAPMAAISARQPLTKADRIDEQTFNESIWKSIKGANSTMPAPRYTTGGPAD
ncbi:MAG: phosphoesterase [Frankiales bacterium]|nr:phosphoesterase [Frankiales bacterium]